MKFGTFSSCKELIDDINQKLDKNSFVGAIHYKDDNRENLNKEVIMHLKNLVKHKDTIKGLSHPVFRGLQKIIKDIEKLKSDDEYLKYVEKEAHELSDKQGLMSNLHHIKTSDLHDQIQKFYGGIKKVEEKQKSN